MNRTSLQQVTLAEHGSPESQARPARLGHALARWAVPLAPPALAEDDVHVWYADLRDGSWELSRLGALLSPDEQRRSAKYPMRKHRVRFVVRRGILRELLGLYLQCKPEHVRLSYGPKGKPSIAWPSNGGGLQFNLAQSRDLALFAFALGRRVGVDVEHMQDRIEHEKIAERFFSPGEATALARLPQAEQVEAFFACWTRKEAVVKMTGEGLSASLASFTVSVDKSQPDELLLQGNRALDRLNPSLVDLAVGPRCRAALSLEGQGWRLSQWRWSASAATACST